MGHCGSFPRADGQAGDRPNGRVGHVYPLASCGIGGCGMHLGCDRPQIRRGRVDHQSGRGDIQGYAVHAGTPLCKVVHLRTIFPVGTTH
ncbi:hypothetical protein SDC9_133284 [bioreactor metagenome]|uniref:Uncharacterized protein n=1 Tax=bioreactor metagenome TaxID=1076179 RepID=A0A645D9V9_9ZZZZ